MTHDADLSSGQTGFSWHRRPFPLSDVRLLDGPCKQAMQLDSTYLLALEPDRLLAGFRRNAVLPPRAVNYAGWESRGVEGHSLGHYLSACAMMFAASGDERFRQRTEYCVAELGDCQAAAADGFLAGMPGGREIFGAIERGEVNTKGGFDLNQSWVPWYTQHKLFAGLRDAHYFSGSERAKHVLIRLGDWAVGVCGHLDDTQMQSMLSVEHGGMMEVLADVSELSGDRRYLALAERFWHKAVLDPLAAGLDTLTGLHANTQIPKVIGAARLYELTGDVRCKAAAETFWNAVVSSRSFVTGSNSDREHFFPLGLESRKLGPQNGETCNVYNLLKLTSCLNRWSDRPEFFDYYERALFNHILGSIDPDTGMTTYFQALESGRFKVYGTPMESFWCCTGTGMENHARYGADIYSRSADDGTLDINLFIASVLTWKDKSLVVRQETDFPEGDTTTLAFTCDRPTHLTLRIRVPEWAEQGAHVTGAVTAHGQPGSGFVVIDRTWQPCDRIMVRMPMGLRLYRSIDDPTMGAVMYGPVVLAAELGREGFPAADNVAEHTVYDNLPVPAVPVVVADGDPLRQFRPIAGRPLRFETNGAGRPCDLILAPLYAVHHQRYAVYLRFLNDSQFHAFVEQLGNHSR